MNTVQSEFAAALALQRRGDLPAAERAYRQLIEQHGAVADAEHMLGLVLHAQGRSEESLPWFERAEAQREGAILWSNHAAALLALGRGEQAAELCRRATRAEPRHPGAWLNLGLACQLERDFGEAARALETTLALIPSQPVAMRALARCRLRLRDLGGALAALAGFPAGKDAAADLIRCEALLAAGERAQATALLTRLAEVESVRKEAWLLQADVASEDGRSVEALDLYRRVVAIDADNRAAHVRAAQIAINRGDVETGLAELRDWLERHPQDQSAASVYLVSCNYSERFDPAALLHEARWLSPAPIPASAWTPPLRSGGKLRVGWVYGSFGANLTEIFFADVLAALVEVAPEIEHILYSVGGSTSGAGPSWLAPAGATHHDCSGLGDRALIERLRGEHLDIVVDLIGRAAGNRAAAFATRMAPVQIGWLDQFQTSGIAAIDYLITDPWLSPPGAEADFSEKLLTLPHGRLAYRPPPAAEPRLEGAASRRFVSFNRFSKIGAGVVEAWAKILRELPDWTLLLKARGGEGMELQAEFRARFAAFGIDPNRVDIAGGGTYAQIMDAYQDAAIALDPFPFTGCSTTCDALWMGLPIVTWPRATIASRQSAALLEAAGKQAWIAQSADDYAAKALALARDESGRREWRLQAREVLRPAFCDAPRLARELIEALRSVAPQR
jgi:protein O-GlcNAc transferase